MNSFNGIGRATKDPEIRFTGQGKKVASFTIAINRAYNREVADFINCTAWGKTADIVESYVRKGDQIGIQGELNIDKYEDKYYTKINVQSVTLLGGKKQSDEATPFDMIDDEEVPF